MAKKKAADTPKVTIAQTGNVQEVVFKAGMTVKQALASAGVSVGGSGQEVRLNNQPCADHDTALSAGDQILVVGRVRGA